VRFKFLTFTEKGTFFNYQPWLFQVVWQRCLGMKLPHKINTVARFEHPNAFGNGRMRKIFQNQSWKLFKFDTFVSEFMKKGLIGKSGVFWYEWNHITRCLGFEAFQDEFLAWTILFTYKMFHWVKKYVHPSAITFEMESSL
jgi:hypothetical protein